MILFLDKKSVLSRIFCYNEWYYDHIAHIGHGILRFLWDI